MKKMTVPMRRRSFSRLNSLKLVVQCSVPLIPAHNSKIYIFFLNMFPMPGPKLLVEIDTMHHNIKEKYPVPYILLFNDV